MRVPAAIAAASLLTLTACGASDREQLNASLNADSDNVPATKNVEEPVEGKMWVTAERIDRHTCPSSSCGIVGTLDFREAATVSERKADWARVSRRYDASCVGGRSEYVDKDNASCTAENGIVGGKFAEWVEARHLAATRPADPAETAAADEQLVKDSDDFRRYRREFVTAARTLIDRGECTAADLQENGGFVKSTNGRDAPVYFTYCGGYTTVNRIYLNARTGEIYR